MAIMTQHWKTRDPKWDCDLRVVCVPGNIIVSLILFGRSIVGTCSFVCLAQPTRPDFDDTTGHDLPISKNGPEQREREREWSHLQVLCIEEKRAPCGGAKNVTSVKDRRANRKQSIYVQCPRSQLFFFSLSPSSCQLVKPSPFCSAEKGALIITSKTDSQKWHLRIFSSIESNFNDDDDDDDDEDRNEKISMKKVWRSR